MPLPPKGFHTVPSAIAPDPQALALAAETLVKAKRPVILVEYAGRDPKCFDGRRYCTTRGSHSAISGQSSRTARQRIWMIMNWPMPR